MSVSATCPCGKEDEKIITELVKKYNMKAHPEGGFYVETYKSPHKVKSSYGVCRARRREKISLSLIYLIITLKRIIYSVITLTCITFIIYLVITLTHTTYVECEDVRFSLSSFT